MAKKQKIKPNSDKLKVLLSLQMQKNSKTYKQVADFLGYSGPCAVANMVKGDMKIPISIIIPLSKCLDIDPKVLLKLAHPDYCEIFESIFDAYTVTDNEKRIISIIRANANERDICPDEEETGKLALLVQDIAKREEMEESRDINERNVRIVRYGRKPI